MLTAQLLAQMNVRDDSIADILAVANDLLSASGLQEHFEPAAAPTFTSRAISNVIYFRAFELVAAAYAYRKDNPAWTFDAAPVDQTDKDRWTLATLADSLESHLLSHDEWECFFVPIDFVDVLYDDTETIPGLFLCSSQRLLSELKVVAPAIGIFLQDGELPDAEATSINAAAAQHPEQQAWLILYECARLSVKYQTAILIR